MDSSTLLATLGLVGGTAVASGLRVYATLAVLGLLHRYEILTLPGGMSILAHPAIVILASTLYVVEFLADKIPAVDSVWDAVHTFIRPPAAALLAFGATTGVAEPWRFGAALLAGSVALGTHGLKSGARLAINTSPEPFSNWGASFAEEISVAGLLWIAVMHPIAAIVVAGVVFLTAIVLFAWLARTILRVVRGGQREAIRGR